MQLLLVLAEALVLSTLSQRRTNYLKEEEKHDRLFYFLTFVVLVFFIGLRNKYNDTWVYIGNYRNVVEPSIREFFESSYEFSDEWGFRLVSSIMKSLGMDEHIYIFLFSCFSVSVSLWYLRKNSGDNFGDAVYLFIATGTMAFHLAAIKQVSATMFALLATNEALKGRWLKYALLMIVAFSFHSFVLVFLVVPFIINKKPWTNATLILVGALFVMGIGMRYLAPLLVRFAEDYTVEGILSSTVNPFRFLVSIVPLVLSFFYRELLYEDSSPVEDLIAHLSICCSMFMFWTLFADPSTVGRVSAYFDLPMCASMAWMIKKILVKTGNNGRIIRLLMYVFFFIFFYYGNFVNKRFDQMYAAIEITDLLKSFTKLIPAKW